jgi:hypothetical protein
MQEYEPSCRLHPEYIGALNFHENVSFLRQLLGIKYTRKQRRYFKQRYSKRGLFKRRLSPQLGPQYGQPSRTIRGELVRSRAEAIIADWFTNLGITYQYEPPLLEGLIFKRAIFKADFFLPQYNAYVEYWGLAYTERNYMQKMQHKVGYYRKNGLRLVSIYPNNISYLDSFLRQELAQWSSYCKKCGQMLKPTDMYCTRCGTKATQR